MEQPELTMNDVFKRLEEIWKQIEDIETGKEWYNLASKQIALDEVRILKRDILNSTLPF